MHEAEETCDISLFGGISVGAIIILSASFRRQIWVLLLHASTSEGAEEYYPNLMPI